jgi:hypothetical protein
MRPRGALISRRAAPLLLALAVAAPLLTAKTAAAFCRSTTCVIADEDCTIDRNGCVEDGFPLRWGTGCVTFAVEADGSPRWDIEFEQARQAARGAFTAWVSARCSDRSDHPSLGAVDLGAVECDVPQYNDKPPLPNANSIVFRDDEWPYGDDTTALALTTITFDSASGEILDADIEVNSASIALSVSDDFVRTDLQAILTHETGHLLGLAHSSESDATMSSGYDGTDLGFRVLASDDNAAICDAYPPGQDLNQCRGAQPRFGFSRVCAAPYENSGCQFGASGNSTAAYGLLLTGLLTWIGRRTAASRNRSGRGRHHRQARLAE